MKAPVWTTEKVATLKKLVSDGLTDREIAERLQAVSECAVKNKRYKLGFTSDRTVWTPEEDELLRQMWADGHKAWVIGNRLDRTASSVKRRREKLNLEPRARGASGMRPEIAREESNEKVFAFLQECVNQNKRVPPLKEMAVAVGLSDTTTRRALRRLAHAGRIKLVGRTHQSVVEIDGKRSLDPRHDDRPLETRFVEFVEGLADRGVAYPGHKQAAVRLFVPRDELVKVIRHLCEAGVVERRYGDRNFLMMGVNGKWTAERGLWAGAAEDAPGNPRIIDERPYGRLPERWNPITKSGGFGPDYPPAVRQGAGRIFRHRAMTHVATASATALCAA